MSGLIFPCQDIAATEMNNAWSRLRHQPPDRGYAGCHSAGPHTATHAATRRRWPLPKLGGLWLVGWLCSVISTSSWAKERTRARTDGLSLLFLPRKGKRTTGRRDGEEGRQRGKGKGKGCFGKLVCSFLCVTSRVRHLSRSWVELVSDYLCSANQLHRYSPDKVADIGYNL